jgi:hypothetical protein
MKRGKSLESLFFGKSAEATEEDAISTASFEVSRHCLVEIVFLEKLGPAAAIQLLLCYHLQYITYLCDDC